MIDVQKSPRVAVLLSGCGYLDGAEIREAVLTLLALDQQGAAYQCIAPNAPQFHVVNHITGEPVPGAERNILEESSRISRMGKCLDLAQARVQDFDALMMPGGYGVAKNHCSFAFKGTEAEVRPDVAAFVGGFFAAEKPVGAICIAPALVALALHGKQDSAVMTLGNDAGVAAAMTQLGQQFTSTSSARELVIDEAHKLVTTPAYMFDEASLADVFVGIGQCVAEVLKRAHRNVISTGG
ncbi:MAG: isoprenoid biosynthesis glyoxalase ElbB [Rhodoferax sp.]|uniref:isoprenoid biosynthesis glyoxalase ElbB n=1 Tax=Rhodoferax sp. TaxID=50421 RepID=UPI001B3F6031|nr:isoprenoid biosynthesis glyoxalase ElbB [Rhodoferax sp.]MBP9907148.1 isoprenoid biosynthesis glyoxalase ElbB [Rhodoferax sp.]